MIVSHISFCIFPWKKILQTIDYQIFDFNQLIVQALINVKRSNIHLISCPINYLVTFRICLVTQRRGPNPQVGKFLPYYKPPFEANEHVLEDNMVNVCIFFAFSVDVFTHFSLHKYWQKTAMTDETNDPYSGCLHACVSSCFLVKANVGGALTTHTITQVVIV